MSSKLVTIVCCQYMGVRGVYSNVEVQVHWFWEGTCYKCALNIY